jgi:hypothetical protein
MRRKARVLVGMLLAIGCVLLGPSSAQAVTYSAGTLEFGKTAVGKESDPRTITVHRNSFCVPTSPGFDCNHDQLDLAVSGPFVMLAQTCVGPGSVAPCRVTLEYRPTAKGRQDGFLRLTSSAIPSGMPRTQGVPLAGLGCKPVKKGHKRGKSSCPRRGKAKKSVGWERPGPLRFPKTRVGKTSPPTLVSVELSHTCNGTTEPPVCDWEPLDVAISGPFVITADSCTAPAGTRPSCSIYVAFRPTRKGTGEGFLRLAGQPIYGVPLAGAGKKPKKK